MAPMAAIRDFHAHIYYDPEQVGEAQALAREAREQFGGFAQWAVLNRRGLTIFAHAETGNDLADHTEHVIWFGPSETLDLSIFG